MASVTVKRTGTAATGSVYVGTNHTPIQNAVDYVASQGGGTVFIEAGTYTCTTPVALASNVELCGEGDATVLTSGTNGALTGSAKAGVYVHDLKIDGSGSTALTSRAMSFTNMGAGPDNATGYNAALVSSGVNVDDGFLVEDVTVANSAGYGIYALNCHASAIRRCLVENAGDIAVYLDNFRGGDLDENVVNNCHYGIYGTAVEDTGFSDNIIDHTWGNTYAALHLVTADRCDFSGNIARNNKGAGFRLLKANGCSGDGNLSLNNSMQGLYLNDVSSGNTLVSNILFANSGENLGMASTTNRRSILAANIAVHGGGYGINCVSTPNLSLVGNIALNNFDSDMRSSGSYCWIGANLYQTLISSGTGTVVTTNIDL